MNHIRLKEEHVATAIQHIVANGWVPTVFSRTVETDDDDPYDVYDHREIEPGQQYSILGAVVLALMEDPETWETHRVDWECQVESVKDLCNDGEPMGIHLLENSEDGGWIDSTDVALEYLHDLHQVISEGGNYSLGFIDRYDLTAEEKEALGID